MAIHAVGHDIRTMGIGIGSTQGAFPRYIQRASFQRLCVFFNMLMRSVVYTATKRFLRNSIAWGLYFKLTLCLLVYSNDNM